MSSETSTDARVGGDLKASDALQPWQLFALAGLVGATIVVFMSSGQSPVAVVLLSLTIFAAAAVGLAALRTFVPLTGTAVRIDIPRIVGGNSQAALEREKVLVLRSIKELEFDRAMGKLSEKDFSEMGARLRARAAGLLRQLDIGAAGYRDQIEQEIERRLGAKGGVSIKQDPPGIRTPTDVADVVADAGRVSLSELTGDDAGQAVLSRPAENECASCGTGNDSDARFCKNCGGRLQARS